MSHPWPIALTVALMGCAPPSPVDPPATSWGQRSLPAAACAGDGDGILGPGELRSVGDLELHATFVLNGEDVDRPEDPWDLDPPLAAGDRLVDLGPRAPEGLWFAARFPAAEFVAPLDAARGTWGVHRLDGDGLWLLGLASDAPGGTALTYDPAVLLVPLPLEVGASWATDAAAEGVVDGASYPQDLGVDGVVSLRHRWSLRVEEAGRVSVPLGELDALRVRATVATEARNSAAGLVASDVQRVDLYLSECLGLVGRVRSRVDEPAEDFTRVTELLRLGLKAELRP